jgi:hypothetical protein
VDGADEMALTDQHLGSSQGPVSPTTRRLKGGSVPTAPVDAGWRISGNPSELNPGYTWPGAIAPARARYKYSWVKCLRRRGPLPLELSDGKGYREGRSGPEGTGSSGYPDDPASTLKCGGLRPAIF